MNVLESADLDFTNILIAICSSIIIYFAWKSTNVRENRQLPATLFVLEGNRRRLLGLGNSRQPVNVIARSLTPEQINTSTEGTNTRRDETTETEERPTETTTADSSSTITANSAQDLSFQEAPSLQSIIDEVADIAMSDYSRTAEETVQNLLDYNDFGPRQIVQEMDNVDSLDDGLRHRRVVDQDENATANVGNGRSSTRRQHLNLQVDSTVDNSHAENCSNENNENENISKTEERTAEREHSNVNNSNIPSVTSTLDLKDKNDEFRIKLKYLNDDLRLVTGTPNEAIGDFKKRNFSVELASEKLVRLVFNGHVLQPDSKTLQACGLFHNCVVHCLIHSKKPTNAALDHGSNRNRNENEQTAQRTIDGADVFVDRSTNGRSFIFVGAVVITLAITFSWYCRLQYSYLFSWYSTVGLVLMTILFLVTFPLIILVEREVSI